MTTRCPVTGTGAPVDFDDFDAAYLSYWHERGRHGLVTDAIRIHLEEQPSSRCVRACTRNWIAELLATAEAVIKKMERE